jgi:hypothetical protein
MNKRQEEATRGKTGYIQGGQDGQDYVASRKKEHQGPSGNVLYIEEIMMRGNAKQ